MNKHQLECFLTLAESLNFARTAELLNISQPAVSRQINSLEKDLGVKLFQRTTRNVSLTSYGEAFLPHAKDIHNRMLAAYTNILHDPDTYVPILNLGCSFSSDLDFFTYVLGKCRDEMPELHPYLQIMSQKRLMNLLSKNALDLAFGYKETIPEKDGLTYQHLFNTDICCAVSSTHPWTARSSISLEELYEEKIILCTVSELPAEVLNLQKQLEYHYAPSRMYYCDDIPITLSFIRAGYGYSILPDLESEHNPGITCIPIRHYKPLSYGYYYKKGREKEDLLKQFIRMLSKL